MVKLDTAIVTVRDVFFIHFPGADVRGTGVYGPPDYTHFLSLPNVSNTEYTTIYFKSFGIEDIGLISLHYISVSTNLSVLGNGSVRWQLSGDGGTTFVTTTERSFNFGAFTTISLFGSGTWIQSILAGHNQFQMRLQAKVVAGTVNTKISDSAGIYFLYRLSLIQGQ